MVRVGVKLSAASDGAGRREPGEDVVEMGGDGRGGRVETGEDDDRDDGVERRGVFVREGEDAEDISFAIRVASFSRAGDDCEEERPHWRRRNFSSAWMEGDLKREEDLMMAISEQKGGVVLIRRRE